MEHLSLRVAELEKVVAQLVKWTKFTSETGQNKQGCTSTLKEQSCPPERGGNHNNSDDGDSISTDQDLPFDLIKTEQEDDDHIAGVDDDGVYYLYEDDDLGKDMDEERDDPLDGIPDYLEPEEESVFNGAPRILNRRRRKSAGLPPPARPTIQKEYVVVTSGVNTTLMPMVNNRRQRKVPHQVRDFSVLDGREIPGFVPLPAIISQSKTTIFGKRRPAPPPPLQSAPKQRRPIQIKLKDVKPRRRLLTVSSCSSDGSYKPRIFHCNMCDSTLSSRRSLESHIHLHRNGDVFVCTHAGCEELTFPTFTAMNKHVSKVHAYKQLRIQLT